MQEVVGSSPIGSIPPKPRRVPDLGTPARHRRCGLRRELARCYTAQRDKECTGCRSGNGNPPRTGSAAAAEGAAVAMKLTRRLRALEQVVAPPDDDGCEACGYDPGSPIKFVVSFEPTDGPDVCPSCGRPLILRLKFNNPRGVNEP